MEYLGEIISLVVACSWTATALFADIASHRLGSSQVNLIRMVLALLFLGILLWITIGTPYPAYADASTWFWLALSGIVGYVFGDYCLFNSYLVFGSRYGQLMMTLAPLFAGIAGWLMLGESMSWHSWLAMLVTLSGIAISILAKSDGKGAGITLRLPFKGVIFGIGAALGQGIGLVLSKIGLEHYAAAIPEGAPEAMSTVMPFAGTFIRAIFGMIGFAILLAASKKLSTLKTALKDRKGMGFAVLTTFFGPFLGVSLSLMAVQYAETGVASTLMALTPVLIILPYSLINHQRITLREVIGTVITVTGVALFFLL